MPLPIGDVQVTVCLPGSGSLRTVLEVCLCSTETRLEGRRPVLPQTVRTHKGGPIARDGIVGPHPSSAQTISIRRRSASQTEVSLSRCRVLQNNTVVHKILDVEDDKPSGTARRPASLRARLDS